jgi:pimeloyl-ACP methyl ester carboxylesterase
VLPLIASDRILGLGGALGGFLARTGLRAGPDIAEMARGYASLRDAEARRAFLNTVRAVIDHSGQRVSAADRLYLSGMLPSLVVWGRRDPLIPAEHAEAAHALMPGSRLESFEEAGHFPQLDHPVRFGGVLREFLEETEPAEYDFSDEDLDELRERMLEHSRGE